MNKIQFPSCSPSSRKPIAPLRKLVLAALVTWPMLGIYMAIDYWPFTAYTTVTMPLWVPFWPVAIIPYGVMLLSAWLLPAAIRDAAQFRACLRTMAFAWLLVFPWWILTPTTIARPPLPENAWATFYRMFWTMDHPHNIAPCAHCVGPLIAIWFLGRDRPAWRLPLALLFLLGLPSIALAWQHRPIDILWGLAAAAIGIAAGEIFERRAKTQTPSPITAKSHAPDTR